MSEHDVIQDLTNRVQELEDALLHFAIWGNVVEATEGYHSDIILLWSTTSGGGQQGLETAHLIKARDVLGKSGYDLFRNVLTDFEMSVLLGLQSGNTYKIDRFDPHYAKYIRLVNWGLIESNDIKPDSRWQEFELTELGHDVLQGHAAKGELPF